MRFKTSLNPTHRALVAVALHLALVLFYMPLAGQDPATGRLVGSITSATRQAPVPGATVRVADGGIQAVANQNGRYQFAQIPVGPAVIVVEVLGYLPRTDTVTVRAGAATVLDLQLVDAPLSVDPVVVFLDRTRLLGDPAGVATVPGAAQILTLQDLQAQNSVYDNVHDVLRQMPGVNVQEEDGFGLRPNIGLRGTGVERSAKITLMEDGILAAPAPYASPSAYYFPVSGRMEAVEVRKGSSQVKYGPRTIGGALNLVSSSIPDRTTWFADVAGGENATLKARGRVGGSNENVGWLIETYQLKTTGFKNLVGGGDTGFQVGDYVGKLRINTNRDAAVYQQLELKLGYTDHTSNETYLGLTDSDFAADPTLRYPASQPDLMDADHRTLQARWFVRPSRVFDITTTAYRNDFRRSWYKLQSVLGTGISSVLADPPGNPEALAILRGGDSDADALKVRDNNRSYFAQGIQTTLGWTRAHHRIEAGARLHQDQEDRFQLEDGYRMVDSRMERTSRGAPGSQSNRVSDANALSLYVQDDMRFGAWTVSPGLRYETIDFTRTDYATDDPDRTEAERVRKNSVSTLIPGIAASYEIRPTAHVFAGVHRGFGPPGPGANPDTDPEESVNYEAGVRFRHRGFATQATVFYSDYRNILGTATLATGESGAGDQFNGGAADVGGLEMGMSYDPAQGAGLPFGVPMNLTYTYTAATFSTSFESDYEPWGTVEAGDEFPYLPRHQFSGSVGVEGLGWRTTLNAFGASAMRTRAGQNELTSQESTDAYVVLNLVAEYGVPWNGTVYLGVQNLLDERYVVARRPAGARPGLPRSLLAGFRISG